MLRELNSKDNFSKMRYLRKIAKTKRDGIQNGVKRIILHKEMAELAQLRWSGYVVRMGDKRYHKMAWQFRTHGKRPKRSPRLMWEEGIHKIRKGQGIEWNGVNL